MQLTLYTSSSAPATLDKSLSQIGAVKALSPTQALDILSPDIIIAYSPEYLGANFCYIDTFRRYYFCTPEVDTAGRLILHCKVDALMSFRDSIKQCPCNVVRSEKADKRYVIDKKLPVDNSRYWIEGRYLSGDVFNYADTSPTAQTKYILLVNGD